VPVKVDVKLKKSVLVALTLPLKTVKLELSAVALLVKLCSIVPVLVKLCSIVPVLLTVKLCSIVPVLVKFT